MGSIDRLIVETTAELAPLFSLEIVLFLVGLAAFVATAWFISTSGR